jgi:hypothetical protein
MEFISDESLLTKNSFLTIPKKVFIVPYRNRTQHKFFFCKYMSFLLENENQGDCEIYFSHQCDSRSFNRGATKNIGFLAIKQKYPNDYNNITFIFNDIDTMPFHKLFDYDTEQGTVKHYYGFKYALGGIVAFKGEDFEKINGYPNFWGWGMEDDVIQKRCLRHNLKIDRSNFYAIGAHEMLQLFDGVSRIISQKDPDRAKYDDGINGVSTISKLNYSIDKESLNPGDNIYLHEIDNVTTLFINIRGFITETPVENETYVNYDLREPSRTVATSKNVLTHNQVSHAKTDNWTNIPYRPGFAEKKEEEKLKKEQSHLYTRNQYNNQFHNTHYKVNKYSVEYARLIQAKPKATKSANIGLGGVTYY